MDTTPTSSRARRLLLPHNQPPPPIPPALLARNLKPRNPPQKPLQPTQAKWIDGGEFALARSSSTSHTRGTPPRRPSTEQSVQPTPAGPPVLTPYAYAGSVKQDTSSQTPPLQARPDLMNRGRSAQAQASSHHQMSYSSSASYPPSRSTNDNRTHDSSSNDRESERTRRATP